MPFYKHKKFMLKLKEKMRGQIQQTWNLLNRPQVPNVNKPQVNLGLIFF